MFEPQSFRFLSEIKKTFYSTVIPSIFQMEICNKSSAKIIGFEADILNLRAHVLFFYLLKLNILCSFQTVAIYKILGRFPVPRIFYK